MTPGCASSTPPQMVSQVVPDDTEVIPPDMHPYYGNPIQVPPVQKYNKRARKLNGNNLLANHVTTIAPPIQIPIHTSTDITVYQIG